MTRVLYGLRRFYFVLQLFSLINVDVNVSTPDYSILASEAAHAVREVLSTLQYRSLESSSLGRYRTRTKNRASQLIERWIEIDVYSIEIL
jgi:hypothetical protein